MANGGGPPPGGQYPQQGGGPPPQQGGGYPPPQGGYQGGGGGYAGAPMSPQGRPLASWGKRVGAALIDGLVVGIPATLLMVLLGVGTFASEDLACTTDPVTGLTECTGGGSFVTKILLSYVIVFALIIAYQIYFNGNERGQTIGKRALNIQVRDEASGGPIGYGKAALRVLVGFALGFLCGIGQIVDLLFPLWDPKRQTLHDKAANTLVVETQ